MTHVKYGVLQRVQSERVAVTGDVMRYSGVCRVPCPSYTVKEYMDR